MIGVVVTKLECVGPGLYAFSVVAGPDRLEIDGRYDAATGESTVEPDRNENRNRRTRRAIARAVAREMRGRRPSW